MKRRIFSVFTSLIFLSLLCSHFNTQGFTILEGVQYSDKLTIGTELAWQLTTLSVSPRDSAEHFEWCISFDRCLSKGDIFKIKLTADLNDLNLSSPEELYYTTEEWADFYANDEYLGNDATEMFWGDFDPEIFRAVSLYILPITLNYESEDVNTFTYLNELYQEYIDDPDLESYTITWEENIFTTVTELYLQGDGDVSIYYYYEVVYNTEWGVLVELNIKLEGELDGENTKVHWTIKNIHEELKVPFNWFYGLIALLLVEVVIIRRRKYLRN